MGAQVCRLASYVTALTLLRPVSCMLFYASMLLKREGECNYVQSYFLSLLSMSFTELID